MILVDHAIYHWRGRKWCHMVSDRCVEELHRFALSLGMPLRAFQDHPKMPHYDIPDELRTIAIARGAVVGEGAQLLAWVAIPDDPRADWRAELRQRYPHPMHGAARRASRR